MEHHERWLEYGILRCGCIRLGTKVILRSGAESDIYIDIRKILSNPQFFKKVASEVSSRILSSGAGNVCGVPDGGVPLAAVAGCISETPILVARKEEKKYGAGGRVFGGSVYCKSCVLVDDVATTGGSVIEAANLLRDEGYTVNTAIVVVDRKMGAAANLMENDINLISLTDIDNLKKCCTNETIWKMDHGIHRLSKESVNGAGRRLAECALRKKSNLIAALDVDDPDSLLELVERLGNQVCCVKVHSDGIKGFDMKIWTRLKELSVKMDFLIMEDRKMADIGSTMIKQMVNSEVLRWADMVTVHGISGEESLVSLGRILGEDQGLVMVAEMSSAGNLANNEYVRKCVSIVNVNQKIFTGMVCQKELTRFPVAHMCPGIKLKRSEPRVLLLENNMEDKMGQRYRTPSEALSSGIDYIIVGRDLYCDADPSSKAEKILQESWVRKDEESR